MVRDDGHLARQTLKFSGEQIGLAYGTTALAAMISPFFVGMVADRFFATERILAVLHLVGGRAAVLRLDADRASAPSTRVLLVYTLCYMPTLALSNSLSFRQMSDPGREFPGVRVLGTIGWIVAGLDHRHARARGHGVPMRIAAGGSLAARRCSAWRCRTRRRELGHARRRCATCSASTR